MQTAGSPPRDYQGLRSLIAERAALLPKRLTQIAAFALEHPDEIAFGTVSSIAELADVQPSALVRFAQSIGYQGFSELQEVFRSRLRDRVLNYEERLEQLRRHAQETSRANVILHGFCDSAGQSVAALREKIEPAQLDRAVAILADARTIYIAGLRRSFPIAAYMAYAFGKLQVPAILIDAVGGLAPEQLGAAGRNDVLLAISFTPYASETVNLALQAKQRGIRLAAITDSPFSPLAQRADVWLEAAESNFEGFRSMAATLALAMTLSVAVADRRTGPPEGAA